MDINNDGFVDLITGGNQFNFIPQLQRLDASFGDILLNDGRGNFSGLAPTTSGLQVQGQVQDIEQLNERNKRYLLFLRNNDHPVLYELQNNLR
jgi:hypothetical protein